jgi:hypothetical protein
MDAYWTAAHTNTGSSPGSSVSIDVSHSSHLPSPYAEQQSQQQQSQQYSPIRNPHSNIPRINSYPNSFSPSVRNGSQLSINSYTSAKSGSIGSRPYTRLAEQLVKYTPSMYGALYYRESQRASGKLNDLKDVLHAEGSVTEVEVFSYQEGYVLLAELPYTDHGLIQRSELKPYRQADFVIEDPKTIFIRSKNYLLFNRIKNDNYKQLLPIFGKYGEFHADISVSSKKTKGLFKKKDNRMKELQLKAHDNDFILGVAMNNETFISGGKLYLKMDLEGEIAKNTTYEDIANDGVVSDADDVVDDEDEDDVFFDHGNHNNYGLDVSHVDNDEFSQFEQVPSTIEAKSHNISHVPSSEDEALDFTTGAAVEDDDSEVEVLAHEIKVGTCFPAVDQILNGSEEEEQEEEVSNTLKSKRFKSSERAPNNTETQRAYFSVDSDDDDNDDDDNDDDGDTNDTSKSTAPPTDLRELSSMIKKMKEHDADLSKSPSTSRISQTTRHRVDVNLEDDLIPSSPSTSPPPGLKQNRPSPRTRQFIATNAQKVAKPQSIRSRVGGLISSDVLKRKNVRQKRYATIARISENEIDSKYLLINDIGIEHISLDKKLLENEFLIDVTERIIHNNGKISKISYDVDKRMIVLLMNDKKSVVLGLQNLHNYRYDNDLVLNLSICDKKIGDIIANKCQKVADLRINDGFDEQVHEISDDEEEEENNDNDNNEILEDSKRQDNSRRTIRDYDIIQNID